MKKKRRFLNKFFIFSFFLFLISAMTYIYSATYIKSKTAAIAQEIYDSNNQISNDKQYISKLNGEINELSKRENLIDVISKGEVLETAENVVLLDNENQEE